MTLRHFLNAHFTLGYLAILVLLALLNLKFTQTAYAETLVVISDKGSRFEATDEPCTTFTKYTFAEGAYEFRHLDKGFTVVSKGCWIWAKDGKRLHVKLWNRGEFFFPVEYFMPIKEAEELAANKAEEKRKRLVAEAEETAHREYIESIYNKGEAARARTEAEQIARENAVKPKTWITHNKFGSVILTQTPCGKKFGGNVAYVRDKDSSIIEGCWGWRDGNILLKTDRKDYMYTPNEFVLQTNQ